MKRLAACVLVAALGVSVFAAFPKPNGYINDFAGVLDASSRAELNALVRDTEQATTVEIAVATVTSLDGMTIEEYANRLFQEWGIGKKGSDNGVLLLVAPGRTSSTSRTFAASAGFENGFCRNAVSAA
jgi:uncharacterized protein